MYLEWGKKKEKSKKQHLTWLFDVPSWDRLPSTLKWKARLPVVLKALLANPDNYKHKDIYVIIKSKSKLRSNNFRNLAYS